MFVFLVGLSLFFHALGDVDQCTTIVVGPKAGIEGAMTTHTADCFNCDFRVSKVPEQDWGPDVQRPVYLLKQDYPSTVVTNRGSTWQPSNLEGTPDQLAVWNIPQAITTHIPQVAHTFGMIEAGYGIANTHQVFIGESTCAARFAGIPVTAGGGARVEARAMTRVALERAKTAREAIQIMGDLATNLGFYAADWSGGDGSLGEGGEALTVIDKTEAWVFHVCGDDTGKSAVWVARRVPDDHVSVVANQFVIRGVVKGSPDFMYSDNLWEVAERAGLWSPSQRAAKHGKDRVSSSQPEDESDDSNNFSTMTADGHLDFLITYGLPRSHPTYATRRVWRVFSVLGDPTSEQLLRLSPHTDMYASDYPFSVPVGKRKITPEDLMNLQRDHYEGTQYDLTKGAASGPYGDPNRFDPTPQPQDNLTMADIIEGGFERAISLFRTSYSIVALSRPNVDDRLALVWFTQYAPSSSSYTPIYVHANDVPYPYTRGSLFKYDNQVPYWNFCAVGNYAARMYRHAFEDVKALQRELQTNALAAVKEFESRISLILSTSGPSVHVPGVGDFPQGADFDVTRQITDFVASQANIIVTAWQDLLPKLITKYHDGMRAEALQTPNIHMVKLFYDKAWLDVSGYWNLHRAHGKDVLLFANSPNYETSSNSNIAGAVVCVLLAGTVMFFVGFTIGQRGKFNSPEVHRVSIGVMPEFSFKSHFSGASSSRIGYSSIDDNDKL